MAHRKLQQEIDRVFKKITEGLEVFDSYYERHEQCTNNPSQKEKLESDLKREVKKLQRLREQIKSWQSTPEVKDKDSLLTYRRNVEVAMEKYKAVEKGSKEKAYSNISLKKSEVLDPQQQAIKDCSDYLSQSIEELDRQFDAAQLDIDKLKLLQKKRKTASASNEEEIEHLTLLQTRYKWHQEKLEIALRLVANEELDPELIRNIEDDLCYYLETNRNADFVEDDSIYDALDLDSNEFIAAEVRAAFENQQRSGTSASGINPDEGDQGIGSHTNGDGENGDIRTEPLDMSKLSKKEQRKLLREQKQAAKLAAKAAAKAAEQSVQITVTEKSVREHSTTPSPLSKAATSIRSDDISEDTTGNKDKSIFSKLKKKNVLNEDSSRQEVAATGIRPSTSSTVTSKQQTPITSKPSTAQTQLSSRSVSPETSQGHQYIHQTLNGLTTTSTLKPAPPKSTGELKWAAAAAQAVHKDSIKPPATTLISLSNDSGSTISNASSSNVNSSSTTTAASKVNTPKSKNNTPSLSSISMNNNLSFSSSNPLIDIINNQKTNNIVKQQEATTNISNETVPEELIVDDYESEPSDDELDIDKQQIASMTLEESRQRFLVSQHLQTELLKPVNIDLIKLPAGLQDMVMSNFVYSNKLVPRDYLRTCINECAISRLSALPSNVKPPNAPMDIIRSIQQWDEARLSVPFFSENPDSNTVNISKDVLLTFHELDTFSLFYAYYFALTPLENKIAEILLTERQWKCNIAGDTWFLSLGDAKFSNEMYEIRDFKIFKCDDWTCVDKVNFKLDYSVLAHPQQQPNVNINNIHTANIPGNTSNNTNLDAVLSPKVHNIERSMSNGQTLLQHLKGGLL
ncbi:related to General negative regulator of transcription subunit 3 [Saccharomycodes ludwigii]|uniref:Related to General negative regulator of transcription subunit 3 n=1 Tax=Saccharomycodes ludwigii TaxID=36035 RepID=A0A376B9G7_9ASCO|nr:hypothetical protein SCDLUD_000379 [Saccharomycodes ludwigii]KAH3902788.1 hypothetical protein SCDLUD_000379 [Saccharomycodes ludwigii]SSD61316.1 related to General negative regulator of transcription subunit 3 [Saccharomycodes ludwigii]